MGSTLEPVTPEDTISRKKQRDPETDRRTAKTWHHQALTSRILLPGALSIQVTHKQNEMAVLR